MQQSSSWTHQVAGKRKYFYHSAAGIKLTLMAEALVSSRGRVNTISVAGKYRPKFYKKDVSAVKA